MNGLESQADGKSIVRGLIALRYWDEDVWKIAGGNTPVLLRRVMGVLTTPNIAKNRCNAPYAKERSPDSTYCRIVLSIIT